MPYYKDNKKIHDSVVTQLARELKRRYPDHEILANPQFRRQEPLYLSDGKASYPDIIDRTGRRVYEVHWKGERKEAEFDLLPSGWKGINVFIDDSGTPDTVIVKMPGFRMVIIPDDNFSNF